MSFKLPKLGFSYDALEPYIDARTMEIHHSKHHAAYTNNLNNAIAGTDLEGKTIEEIFSSVNNYPVAVRNNGGGYYNHNLFWDFITPGGAGEPSGKLKDAIVKNFGSVESLKDQFSKAAATRFGSGWAWLVKADDKLIVTSTANQDNPLMADAGVKGTPILNIDVWEHAYYLKYQNKRPDYIAAFWNVVNWDVVAEYFKG